MSPDGCRSVMVDLVEHWTNGPAVTQRRVAGVQRRLPWTAGMMGQTPKWVSSRVVGTPMICRPRIGVTHPRWGICAGGASPGKASCDSAIPSL